MNCVQLTSEKLRQRPIARLMSTATPNAMIPLRTNSSPPDRRKSRSISRPTTAMVSAATGIARYHEPVVQITVSAT